MTTEYNVCLPKVGGFVSQYSAGTDEWESEEKDYYLVTCANSMCKHEDYISQMYQNGTSYHKCRLCGYHSCNNIGCNKYIPKHEIYCKNHSGIVK